MKIRPENSPHLYKIREKQEGVSGQQQGNGSEQVRRFDEVLLDASSRDIEEKLLSEKVADQLKTQIRSVGSEEHINELKRAVKEGTYVPDERMMSVCMLITEGDK